MSICRRVATIAAAALVVMSLLLTPLFHNKVIVVVSGSMEPTIHTYALALVHFCDIDDLDVGDIIVYYHPRFEELITHRVIVKGEDYVWTQGDANDIADDIAVVDGSLYGKVIYVANWAVSIMRPFVEDRQFDRGSMVTSLVLIALLITCVCFCVSLVVTYGTAFVFVKTKRKYSEEDLQCMTQAVARIQDSCTNVETASTWEQVQLRVAFRVWKQQFIDMGDEMDKIQGVKRK